MSVDHDHASQGTHRSKLAIAVGITVAILVAEVIGAWWTNSLALLVDAGHMLTAASGLLRALIAANFALRPPTSERTWGYRRAEVLAAGAQAAVLLGFGVFAFVEGVRRLHTPAEVTAGGLLVFGIVGLVGNLVSMLVLSSGRSANLNMRRLPGGSQRRPRIGCSDRERGCDCAGWTRIDALAGMPDRRLDRAAGDHDPAGGG